MFFWKRLITFSTLYHTIKRHDYSNFLSQKFKVNFEVFRKNKLHIKICIAPYD